MRAELADNPFGRPLYVESSQNAGEHKGAIYAVIEQPFKRVGAALRHAAQWCDVLILQANVKNCKTASNGGGERLSIFVARKPTDAPDRAYRVDFSYDVPAAGADYLHVALSAPEGPLGTTDYRIRLGGVRGVVERNTMRYYLAVEAYLGTLDAPAAERVEKRLRAFHAGLERDPRQLHELAEYLEIKRRDASRVLQARQ